MSPGESVFVFQMSMENVVVEFVLAFKTFQMININSIYTAHARPLEAHTLDNRAQAIYLHTQPGLPHQMSQSQGQSPTSSL